MAFFYIYTSNNRRIGRADDNDRNFHVIDGQNTRD